MAVPDRSQANVQGSQIASEVPDQFLELAGFSELCSEVPGLHVQSDVLPEDLEKMIMSELDQKTWSSSLSRRTIHQGYVYPYSGGSLQKTDPIEGLLKHLAIYLRENNIMGKNVQTGEGITPDQVIVNEYLKDQSIGAHTDRKDFGPVVVAFSLNADTNFIFRNPLTNQKVELYVPRRSIMIMTGESRNVWTHEIPKRKSVTDGSGKRITKSDDYRRVSITYRTV